MILCEALPSIISFLPTNVINLVINDNEFEMCVCVRNSQPSTISIRPPRHPKHKKIMFSKPMIYVVTRNHAVHPNVLDPIGKPGTG